MNIEYGCVVLRAIEEKDFDLLFQMINMPEIQKQHKINSYPINSTEQREWMRNFHNSDKWLRLIIELNTGVAIGLISLEDIDAKNGTAKLHYKVLLGMEGRIKGDIYDAISGMIQYAFDWMRLNCIEAKVIESNIKSRKILEKLGFKEEGVLRQRIFGGGEYHDFVSYSILKDEFFASKPEK